MRLEKRRQHNRINEDAAIQQISCRCKENGFMLRILLCDDDARMLDKIHSKVRETMDALGEKVNVCKYTNDRNSCTGRSRPGAAGRGPGKERLQRRGPGPAAPGGMCCNRFARLAHLPAGQFFSFDAIYKRNPPIFLANCRKIRYTYIVTNGRKSCRSSLRKRKMILPCVPERKGA